MSATVRKTILDNSISVLTEQMEGIRSVSVGVICDVGPKDERPEERGYAHLIEHMVFQGTGDRSAQAIAEMMEIGGGAMGAFTARDYTVYHATVLDEYLPFALDVLGDMISNSVLADEAIDRQRAVILQEMAGHDDPLQVANDLLKANLWPNHPLSNRTAGTEEALRAATRDSLLNFMNRCYVAERIVVAAAGSVDHDSFTAQVWDAFWQIRSGQGSGPARLAPAQFASGSLVARQLDLRQVYFALAWPAPVYASPDRYAWHVLSNLFGGGATSLLFQKLREEKGLAYHIGSQYQAYGSAGALVVEGATLSETLLPTIAGVLIELMRLGAEELDLDRYHHSIQTLISQHLVSGDSAYVRMSRLGLQELYFRKPILSAEVSEQLRALAPDAIQAAARQMLAAGLPSIALVGPVEPDRLEALRTMLSDFGDVRAVGFVADNGLLLSPETLGVSVTGDGSYLAREVCHAS